MDWITSPWPPLLAIWAIAAMARWFHGTWFAPAAAAALWWSAYCGVAVWALEIDIRSLGLWVIVGFVFSLCAGSFLAGNALAPANRVREQALVSAVRKLQWFVVITNVLAFLGICYYAIYGLQSFGLTFDMAGLLRLGAGWSAARYDTGEPEPLVARLLFTWLYPAAVASGMLFAVSKSRKLKSLCLSPLFLAVLISLVEATRAGIMYSVGCWAGGYYAMRFTMAGTRPKLFTRSFILKLATFALLGVVLFMAIDAFRGGISEDKQIDTSFNRKRFAKYAVGSIPGFTQWYQHYDPELPALGAWTFTGPFNLIGLKTREEGVFTDLIILSDGEDLNLYTCFRGLILDFTLPGVMLLMFVVGYGVQRAFLHLSEGNPLHLIVVASSYMFIVASPIISMFTYNGIVLAFAGTWAILYWNMRKLGEV